MPQEDTQKRKSTGEEIFFIYYLFLPRETDAPHTHARSSSMNSAPSLCGCSICTPRRECCSAREIFQRKKWANPAGGGIGGGLEWSHRVLHVPARIEPAVGWPRCDMITLSCIGFATGYGVGANHENCEYEFDQPVCNDKGNVYIRKSQWDEDEGIWTASEAKMYRRKSDYCNENSGHTGSELSGCVWAPLPEYTYQAKCNWVKKNELSC